MAKQHVKWKKVTFKDCDGDDFDYEVPEMLDRLYRGRLLGEIFAMPLKKPIVFDDAVRLAAEKHLHSEIGRVRGESHWYFNHFVEWISEIGYHIELTGDEFESPVPISKAS